MGAQLDELIRAVLQHPAMTEERGECATVKVKITGIEIEISLKCDKQGQESTGIEK